MSKCPCKIKKQYFVITDYAFIECSRKLWDSYSRYALDLSDPFELDTDWYFHAHLPRYDHCRSAVCTVAFFDDSVHGVCVPVFVRVSYYIEEVG